MDQRESQLYFLPSMSEEDRKQDAWLSFLEKGVMKHRPPSSAVFGRELGYGLGAPDMSLPLLSEPTLNPEAMEKVLQWMFEQEDQIQCAVIAFLSEPTEPRFENVLRLINVATEEIYQKPMTLVQLIMRCLPAKKEELYMVARDQHRAKRPEAAIRQLLRRLIDEGRIILEEGYYHASQGTNQLAADDLA